MIRNGVALILILILTNVFLGTGSTVTIAQEEEMSRSLPLFLLTVRGTLAASTRADAATIHNETAGSEEAIAGARALGDISHMVYLPLETPSEGAGEVLFMDLWTNPEGINQFFSNPDVQASADRIFSNRDATVWVPAEGFYTYHFQPRFGENDRYVVMVRGMVNSREEAMTLHNAIVGGALAGARQAGDLSHEVYFRLTPPGEPESLEFLAIDVWVNLEGMTTYYQNPQLQEGFSQLFSAPPEVSMWVQSTGDWREW
jgi:quinol monooxygenase YgiN